MKMKYRGNDYRSETSVMEMTESDIIGKYRGLECGYKLPKHIPQLRPKLGLTYRGITYNTCPNTVAICTTNQTPVKEIAPHSRIPNHQNLGDIHLQNLKLNLERRIRVAQENQNDYLLEMLRKESLQLTICH